MYTLQSYTIRQKFFYSRKEVNNLLNNIDQQKLIKAALIVALFGIFVLSLTYVIPLLGILGALVIIAAGIYALYLLLTGKLKL